MSTSVIPTGSSTTGVPEERRLTASEFHTLATVPPEADWFANITNKNTRRAYQKEAQEFMSYISISDALEMRLVSRAHILAWRKTLEGRSLKPSSIRRKLSAVSSLFERLCEAHAIAHNPVNDAPQTFGGMTLPLDATDLVAIYGATLSTAVAIWEYFRSRSKVRVVLIFAIEKVDGEMQHGIAISTQNPSAHVVHLTNVSLLYPYSKLSLWGRLKNLMRNMIRFKRILWTDGWCHSALSLHGVDDGCPVSIEPGKSHSIFVRHEVLEAVLAEAHSRRLKAVVQDALWRNKYSKAFDYPLPPAS